MEALVMGILLDMIFFARFLYKKPNSIKPKASQMEMTDDTLLSLYMDTEGIIMSAV